MADQATYFLLVKLASQGPAKPAAHRANEDPPPTAIEIFAEALTKATDLAAAVVNEQLVAQGAYDFIVSVTIDLDKYNQANPGVGATSALQVALGLAAAVSHNAGVTTETVPVVQLDDQTVVNVAHSCGL